MYEKLNLPAGHLLRSTHLAHIEDGIATAENKADANSVAIGETNKNVDNLSKKTEMNRKRIANLEGATLDFTEDSSVAYEKSVPNTALPYAKATMIGGMTYRENNELRKAQPTSLASYKSGVKDLFDINDFEVCSSSLANIARSVLIENGVISFAHSAGLWGGASLLFEVVPQTDVEISWEAVSGSGTLEIVAAESVEKVSYTDKYGIAKEGYIYRNTTPIYGGYDLQGATSVTFTQPADKRYFSFALINPSSYPNGHYAKIRNLRVMGTSPKGVLLDEFALPQSLPTEEYGLGLGVPTAPAENKYFNRFEIDENGRVFCRKAVKKVVYCGNANEGWMATNASSTYKVVLKDAPTFDGSGYCYAICDKYVETQRTLSDDGLGDKEFYCRQSWYGGGAIAFCNEDTKSLSEWQQYLAANPITLIYSLTANEENRLADDRSKFVNGLVLDTLINVEGGGAIVAENEHKLAVPTTIVYAEKIGD